MPAKDQNLRMVTKPILYKNPDSPLFRKVIKPGDKEAEKPLPFPHLDAGELALLERKGYLGPIPKSETKSESKVK